MLNIAVLVYNLINNYNYTVVDGIVSYLQNKADVRLIVAPVNIPHAKTDNYDYHYWSSAKLLQCHQVDGAIIIPNSFSNYINFETLSEELQEYAKIPVVSISRKMNLPGCKYTVNSSADAYEQIIEHLMNIHSSERIAFFGAGLIDAPESEERLQSFKKALKRYKKKFYPDLVFQGDFTPGTAEEVLSKKIKSKEDINFDAICCLNDFTCGGCIYYFEKIGVKVPDDVIVIGYDDSDFALKIFPRLTTIDQAIPDTGRKAAELLYKTLKNGIPDEVIYTDSHPVYRQSCGCIECKSYSTAYFDWRGNYYEKDEKRKKAEISSIKKHTKTLSNIYNIINLIDNKTTLETMSDAIRSAMKMSDFTEMSVYLYEEPVVVYAEDNFICPEKAKVQFAMETRDGELTECTFREPKEIVLKERVLFDEFEKKSGGQYFMHPIFIRNRNFGYMLCKSATGDYIAASINMKVIADIIVNSYEGSEIAERQKKLIENNLNLSFRSKTDELTKLFNRRGFMEYGQRLIEMSVVSGKTGGVFFCDLDGLKTINDTWGHEIGDLAIETEASVLKTAFRTSDMIGRLSGDEFAIVAPGFNLEYTDSIRHRLAEINEQLSKEAGLPFTLSISFGVVPFNGEDSDIYDLLKKADEQLYEEKKLKHPERNYK